MTVFSSNFTSLSYLSVINLILSAVMAPYARKADLINLRPKRKPAYKPRAY